MNDLADVQSRSMRLYGVEDDTPEQEISNVHSRSKSVYQPTDADRGIESWGDYGTRLTKQVGSRLLETALGAPTDIARSAAMPGQFIEQGLSNLTPEPLKEMGLDFGTINKSPHQYLLEQLGSLGKSTKEYRELFKNLSESDLEPHGTFENVVSGIAQDLPLLLISPGATIPRTIASSLVGNVSKEFLKDMGFKETGQEVGKFAAQTLTSLLNPNLVTGYFNNQYNAARNAIPANATQNATNLISRLGNFIARARNEIGTAEQAGHANTAIARAEEIIARAQANGNRLPIRDIWDFKRAINGEMQTYGRYFRELQNPLRGELRNYGRINPTFERHFRNGEQSFMGYMESRNLANNISRISRLTPQTILGSAIIDTMLGKWVALPIVGGSFAAIKSFEMIHRALLNPTIRNLYLSTIATGAANNAPAFLKNVDMLEEKINKETK